MTKFFSGGLYCPLRVLVLLTRGPSVKLSRSLVDKVKVRPVTIQVLQSWGPFLYFENIMTTVTTRLRSTIPDLKTGLFWVYNFEIRGYIGINLYSLYLSVNCNLIQYSHPGLDYPNHRNSFLFTLANEKERGVSLLFGTLLRYSAVG